LPLVGVIGSAMDKGLSDNEIVALVRKGDQQAFGGLVARYQNYVFTIILRYLTLREDAEELAQDVFVKAYRGLADFRGESKFSTWLYTITTTSAISFLRKNKLQTVPLDDDRAVTQDNLPHNGAKANQAEQQSTSAIVNSTIRLLSPDDAQVITLFYKAEQSLEEIAQILGIETNTVKVRLHRARQRLKEKMIRQFPQEINDLVNH
jgi:RNA polymerase sigma factor (sigma-70 family)